MSDITDWNRSIVDKFKKPGQSMLQTSVGMINSGLKPPGSIEIGIPIDKDKGIAAHTILKICKEHAEICGLEFRNLKEIVLREHGYNVIIYTAEEKEKEMSEENWREKRCVHGLGYGENCLSCKDSIEEMKGGKVKTDKESFDLTQIPLVGLIELGKVFREGEDKYGLDNWKLGRGVKEFRVERANHAIKHLLYYVHDLRNGVRLGDKKENDLAKVMWFCVTEMEFGRLNKDEEKEVNEK